MRSDIFSYIQAYAREADKLNYYQIYWHDREILKRVLVERVNSSLGITGDDEWISYFAPTVKGVLTPQYILNRIVPRPRDLIILCQRALAFAIDRNHSIVEQEDILSAEKDYSEHAYLSLLTEIKPEIPQAEALLYELIGSTSVISENELIAAMQKVGIPESSFSRVIDLLLEAMFLGIEQSSGEYKYIEDERDKKRLMKQAETQRNSGLAKYQINVAYHLALDIN